MVVNEEVSPPRPGCGYNPRRSGPSRAEEWAETQHRRYIDRRSRSSYGLGRLYAVAEEICNRSWHILQASLLLNRDLLSVAGDTVDWEECPQHQRY